MLAWIVMSLIGGHCTNPQTSQSDLGQKSSEPFYAHHKHRDPSELCFGGTLPGDEDVANMHVDVIFRLLMSCPNVEDRSLEDLPKITAAFRRIEEYSLGEIYVAIIKYLGNTYTLQHRLLIYLLNMYLFLGCPEADKITVYSEFIFSPEPSDRVKSALAKPTDFFVFDSSGNARLAATYVTSIYLGPPPKTDYDPLSHFISLRKACVYAPRKSP
jgi:hypothetical protein